MQLTVGRYWKNAAMERRDLATDPVHVASSASETAARRSRLPKRVASSSATRSPTSRIPIAFQQAGGAARAGRRDRRHEVLGRLLAKRTSSPTRRRSEVEVREVLHAAGVD